MGCVSPTYKWFVYWGEPTHSLAIDPNFQRDILVARFYPPQQLLRTIVAGLHFHR